MDRAYTSKVADNVDSVALSHATPAEIGPATSYNLDGTGMVAGVWDAARARDTHVDFQNATSPSPINNGAKRVRMVDGTSLNFHSTHVTGTIIGDGTGNAAARGYAPKACVVSYSWNSMDTERRTARHDYRHVADNHSYGTGTPSTYTPSYYGGYDSDAQTSDTDIRDILLNMCKSAGNDGSFGSLSCTHDACMKNSFTIASTSDGGTVSSFSSRGPTLDGRLIPHFAANGENLTSTYETSNTAYGTISGTSMASPSACGSLVLLAQLFQREYNKQQFSPDLARAIVAATAIERGNQGPDYRYGFGIIDCKRAADLILADKAGGGNHVVRGTMRQGNILEYNLQVTSSAAPLKVVCSWLDIYASTASGNKLINDIDLELIEPNGSTTHYPWSGLASSAAGDQTYQWTRTGPNRRDNIELVEVDAPTVGTWKIRVTGFSVPANPQTTVRNDATGFVLASEAPITANQERFVDTAVAASPLAIPDNDTNGVSRTFNVTSTDTVKNVRVIVDVRHVQRGDIDVYLTHGATTAQIEKKDTSTRDDLIAVYPDTRQYDDDTAGFIGQVATGTWTVKVTDTTASNTGTLDWLAIEIDYAPNQAPVANAGTDQSVNEGATVNLTGAASTDPDNDTLSFAWTQVSGTSVSLSGAATATPSFTAPMVTSTTLLTFRVTVSDGRGGSDFDDVQITVNDVNNPPVANAGSNQSVNEGTAVNLSAAGSSDPDGDPLGYSWTQTSGPAVTLSGAGTVAASFTAPQVTATTIVVLRVTVSDGRGGSDFADVQVTVNDVVAPNNPPVANAGANFNVTEGLVANLSGAASTDPDGDPLSYSWTQIGGSAVTLAGAATVAASFTAPMVAASTPLTFRLTVNDGRGGINTDDIVVTVLDSAVNNPPTANAGADQAVSQGAAVNLNGAASNDPEGDTLTFAWVQISGVNTVVLNNAATAAPDFVAPVADDVLVFRLTVDDGHGNIDTDEVAITVGTPPVGSSGGGGKKGGKGGCSTSEESSWMWLLAVLAPLAMLRRARGSKPEPRGR